LIKLITTKTYIQENKIAHQNNINDKLKETIIRLTEWYYSQAPYDPIDKETKYRTDKDNSPLRFSASGIEFLTGCSKEEDFDGIEDYISFSNFRLMIKL
jgi:hypothetical protein